MPVEQIVSVCILAIFEGLKKKKISSYNVYCCVLTEKYIFRKLENCKKYIKKKIKVTNNPC